MQKTNQKLANVSDKHHKDLNDELLNAISLENALKTKPYLDECCSLIKSLVIQTQEKTPELLDRIRHLIDMCTDEHEHCGALIWRNLYFTCANGVIEDSWSEKHFQDHLHDLFHIVLKSKGLFESRINYAANHPKQRVYS